LTTDAEGVAKEQRIQRAFIAAVNKYKNNSKDGRRVTFSETVNREITGPEEGDELEGDDVAQTIADILTKLDAGAEQFASEAQERPNYVYNLTGKLCSQLHLLKETNDLLH
jgi:hypothetical protein